MGPNKPVLWRHREQQSLRREPGPVLPAANYGSRRWPTEEGEAYSEYSNEEGKRAVVATGVGRVCTGFPHVAKRKQIEPMLCIWGILSILFDNTFI